MSKPNVCKCAAHGGLICVATVSSRMRLPGSSKIIVTLDSKYKLQWSS